MLALHNHYIRYRGTQSTYSSLLNGSDSASTLVNTARLGHTGAVPAFNLIGRTMTVLLAVSFTASVNIVMICLSPLVSASNVPYCEPVIFFPRSRFKCIKLVTCSRLSLDISRECICTSAYK